MSVIVPVVLLATVLQLEPPVVVVRSVPPTPPINAVVEDPGSQETA